MNDLGYYFFNEVFIIFIFLAIFFYSLDSSEYTKNDGRLFIWLGFLDEF